jgi:hypothetical protein
MRKYGTHCVLCEDRLGPLEGLTEGVILPRGSFYRGHFTDGVTIEGGYYLQSYPITIFADKLVQSGLYGNVANCRIVGKLGLRRKYHIVRTKQWVPSNNKLQVGHPLLVEQDNNQSPALEVQEEMYFVYHRQGQWQEAIYLRAFQRRRYWLR